MLNSRKLAIAGSIAALSIAAAPIAAVAATTQHSTTSAVRTDRSLDSRDLRHADKTPDRAGQTAAGTSRDVRDG